MSRLRLASPDRYVLSDRPSDRPDARVHVGRLIALLLFAACAQLVLVPRAVAQEEGTVRAGGWGTAYHVSPQLWFNRVDALHAGLEGEADVSRALTLRAEGAYKTGLEAFSYGVGATWRRDATALEVTYHDGIDRRYRSHVYSRFSNSALMLVAAARDYYDYYDNRRLRVAARRYVAEGRATVEVGFSNERHASAPRTSSYDLLGNDTPQPPNPPVAEGWLRSANAAVTVGGGGAPWGVAGRRFVRVGAEYSSPDLLGSDFDFARFWGEAEYSLPTFFRDRAYPSTLVVRLTGGTFVGTLPPQRYGIVEASVRPLTPFGVLKTLADRPYAGEQHAALYWEHDFRGALFERAGLWGLARRGWGLIVHGGHGRTWVSEAARARLGPPAPVTARTPDGVHHELGLSLNGLLGILRLDVTARLDAPGVFVGISAARLF